MQRKSGSSVMQKMLSLMERRCFGNAAIPAAKDDSTKAGIHLRFSQQSKMGSHFRVAASQQQQRVNDELGGENDDLRGWYDDLCNDNDDGEESMGIAAKVVH